MSKFTLITATLLTLCLPLLAQAGTPSAGTVEAVLEAQLRASAQEQIDYMRKINGEDSLNLARAMGTLVEPEHIHVSDLVLMDSAFTENGMFDANTEFMLQVGKTRERIRARVRLRQVEDEWQVVLLRRY